jgi:DNA-binding MarR family transcriptional regulator
MTASRKQLAANAWGSVLQVRAALVPVFDRELQVAARLPLSWYDVLLELSAAPGERLKMTELSERVVLSRTRVSRVVDELAAAGLVGREQNDADKRSAFAILTPLGREAFEKAAPFYLSSIESGFAGPLSDDELRAIADVLGRVLAGLPNGPVRRPSAGLARPAHSRSRR